MNESFLYAAIMGRDCLFYHKPLAVVPDGLFCYHLSDPYGYDYPEGIHETVDPTGTFCGENPENWYWGTVLLREPLDLASDEFQIKDGESLMIAFYEDGHGNPVPITAKDYLAGVEPAALTAAREMDEDEIGF